MPAAFRVLTTPAFECSAKKLARGNPKVTDALEMLIAILESDPYNRMRTHPIKKLAGIKPGQGQWRIRERNYRLRYDISGQEVVLHSLRDRKEAY